MGRVRAAEGEEVTLMYAYEDAAHLLDDYGFDCRCSRCMERGDERGDLAFQRWRERACCPAGRSEGGCGCGIGVPVETQSRRIQRRCANCAHAWWARN